MAPQPTATRPSTPSPPSEEGRTRGQEPSSGGPGGPVGPPDPPTGGGGNGGGDSGGGPSGDGGRQRLVLLVVAILGILIIAIALLIPWRSAGNGDETATETTVQQTLAPQATQADAGDEQPATAGDAPADDEPTDIGENGGAAIGGDETPAASLPQLRPGRIERLTVTQGERVRFAVTAAQDGEVHVHGYDREYDLQAGETRIISFPADITGIFEIELHGSEEQIGELTVEP